MNSDDSVDQSLQQAFIGLLVYLSSFVTLGYLVEKEDEPKYCNVYKGG